MEEIEAFSTRLLIAVYGDAFARRGCRARGASRCAGGSLIAADATKPRTIANRPLSYA
jgi:hypothetical protein